MQKGAVISKDEKYRYELSRVWDENLPEVVFIGLNPSTADDKIDDPTITRCISFARSWGYGGFRIFNLFAYRATNPEELLKTKNPIGEENDTYLKKACTLSDKIICAWGNEGQILNRSVDVLKIINNPFCIKMNKSGQPAHPLYLKGDLQPISMNNKKDKSKGKFDNLKKYVKERSESEHIHYKVSTQRENYPIQWHLKKLEQGEEIKLTLKLSDNEMIFTQSDAIVIGDKTLFWYQSRVGTFYTKSNGEFDAEHESEEYVLKRKDLKNWRAVTQKKVCFLELECTDGILIQSVQLNISELSALCKLQEKLNAL